MREKLINLFKALVEVFGEKQAQMLFEKLVILKVEN